MSTSGIGDYQQKVPVAAPTTTVIESESVVSGLEGEATSINLSSSDPLSFSSTGDSSLATSGNRPRQTGKSLSKFFANLLKPCIGQLNTSVETCLTTQKNLKELLEAICLDLASALELVHPTVELEQYTRKINWSKSRIIAIQQQLQIIQARLVILEFYHTALPVAD